MLADIPVEHYSYVALFLFFAGIYGFFTRKNMIAMLISIELILNGINLQFVAFNKYLYPDLMEGMIFSMFIIGVAAAEAAVAIAIIINVYRRLKTINIEKVNSMKY